MSIKVIIFILFIIISFNFTIVNYISSNSLDEEGLSLYELRGIDISGDADLHFSSGVRVDKYENIQNLTLGNCSGNILAYNSNLEKFYIHSTDSLDIMLGSKVNLIQSKDDDITVKSGDKIFVAGDDNKITVLKDITINGELSFDENSELTFEFDEKYENQVVLFNTSSALQLTKGSRLIFKGRGTVRFADGQQLSFLGTTDSDKPFLVLTDSASLELESNATANIVGIGKITIDKGSLVDIGSTRQLIIGESTSNDIDIKVDRDSAINVDSSRDSSSTAILSIQKATCTLDFEQGGTLSIGDNGIVEINALNNVEQRGRVSSFKFDANGILSIESDGKLRVGRNIFDNQGSERTFDWDNFGGQIVGSGIVEYVVTSDFNGQLQNIKFDESALNIEQLVGKLIQTTSELSVSTSFIDENGNKKVRTIDGVIVSLLPDDEITRDNAAGYIYGTNKNVPFTITPAGLRSS